MSAREEVLGRIRSALAGAAAPGPVPREYDRSGAHVRGSVAAVELLAGRLTDYRASVVRATASTVAQAVADQLAGATSVVVPDGVPEGWLAGLARAGCAVRRDAPALSHADLDGTDAVLTTCRVAVAETGTLVLDGGPGQGRRVLSLLPDRHVAVVMADQVVHTVPEAVELLADAPHRPLTWISGPSATSDIELIRVEGVHGPRDLRVVLVEP